MEEVEQLVYNIVVIDCGWIIVEGIVD